MDNLAINGNKKTADNYRIGDFMKDRRKKVRGRKDPDKIRLLMMWFKAKMIREIKYKQQRDQH